GSPQLTDLAPYALRSALALPDEAVDEKQRDEEQNDQKQDQKELERRRAQQAPQSFEEIHWRPRCALTALLKRSPARSCGFSEEKRFSVGAKIDRHWLVQRANGAQKCRTRVATGTN